MNSFNTATFFAESVLLPEHLQEWLASGVNEEIIRLNVHSVSGAELFEIRHPKATATQSGTGVRRGDRKNLDICLESVAWEVNGRVKPTSGPLCSQGKYLSASGGWEDGKYVKVRSKLTFLRMPLHIWQKVSERYGVSLPENPVIEPDGAAIGFWDWVRDNNIPITLTEGEKKAGCLLTLGYAAISIPGINSGYRAKDASGNPLEKKILHENLIGFDTAGRDIIIAFDYRAGNYFYSVEFKTALVTAKCLQKAIAKIAQLPGPEKGIDDFAVAGGDVAGTIDSAKILKDLQAESLWHSYRGFSPDIISDTRYFDAEAPKSGLITAIKSGLGTGKTEYLKNKVASDNSGTQINLTYRNSLGLQLAEKLGSNHLDAHDGYRFFLDPNARLTLCIDSLLKVPVERLEGCTLIIDESASVVKHLLESRTLFGKRLEVLERFELACKLADRIVPTDGNLADWVVNYIAKLAGNKAILKIENQFKGDTPPVIFLEPPLNEFGKRQNQAFFEGYANQIIGSGRPAIATDSLQQAEALAKRLTDELGDGILLSSKTVTEPWAKEFLKDPDAYFESQQPAWLVFTPTAESGVDISIRDYFSDVFCWFVGVLDVDGCMQMSRRVRNPIGNIYIYCAERGFPGKNGDATYGNIIANNIAARVTTEAKVLTDAELTDATQLEIELQSKSPHFQTYCKIQAKKNLERRDLRGYLFKAFAIGGYAPKMRDGIISGGEFHKLAKGECRDLACQQIFEAEDITFEKATEIERGYDANWLDRCKVIRFKMLDKLPGLKDSELWSWEFVRRYIYEERALRSQLESEWLFQNQDDAEYLQRRKWREPLKTFLPDISDRWLKLRAMAGLNLQQFIDPEKTWTANSPEVQQIIKLCKKKAIANILGYPTDGYEMRFINGLLGIIGIKLVAQQVRDGDERFWQYRYQPTATIKLTKNGPVRVCSLPENWQELSEFTAVRMTKKISSLKMAEMLANKELEFVTDAPINDIKKAASVTESEPIPEPEPTGRTGWINRWGQWVRASFLAATDGAQYRMLIQEIGGWAEVLAWPDKIQWDAAF